MTLQFVDISSATNDKMNLDWGFRFELRQDKTKSLDLRCE